jgi:hypothetical protein
MLKINQLIEFNGCDLTLKTIAFSMGGDQDHIIHYILFADLEKLNNDQNTSFYNMDL